MKVAEPGLFGVVDDYTPATNQALALLALTAAGAPVPTAAVDWLVAQQCTAPASAAGGWEGYRAPSGGGLEPCEESTSLNFTSADSNSTAFAVQALRSPARRRALQAVGEGLRDAARGRLGPRDG